MINDELTGYIKQQLALKVSREVITTNLKGAGWTDVDVSEAFRIIIPLSAPAPIPVTPMVPTMTPNVSRIQPIQPIQPVQPIQPAQPVFSSISRLQTAQPINSFEPAHKSKKLLLAVIILILLCLAGGAGVYAYYTGYFVNLPDLVKGAMSNAQTSKSAQYDVTFNVDFSELKTGNSPLDSLSTIGINSKQLTFTMNGSSDVSDIKNPKVSSIISLSVGGAASVEFEIRLIDKTFYGQLTKNPTLGNFPLSIATISPYVKKWYSAKIPDGQPVDGSISTTPPTGSGFTSSLTVEQQNQLRKMFQDANLIKTLKKLNTETVGGVSSYHFSFDLDKEGIISFVQSLITYIKTNIIKDNSELAAFDKNEFSKAFDQIKDFKGEMWIGRSDKLIHKVALNFGIQPDPTKNEQLKINANAIFSGYNQPVSIVAPAESTSFTELMPQPSSSIEVTPKKLKAK